MMIVAGIPVCEVCLDHLVKTKTRYICPKHGDRTNPILDAQVPHHNQNAGKGGHGSSSKGRKRKKPKKMTPWWAGNSFDT